MPDRPLPESIQDRISGFWSAAASTYDAHEGNVEAYGTPGYAAWVRAIGDALPPPPADVLDVGAGTGFASLIAAGLGHRVTGVELAEPMLAEARAKAARLGISADFRLGDAVAPPLSAESVDVVMSRHVYWTLREPATALANWWRLLRNGGRVVIIDEFVRWDSDSDDGESGIFAEYYDRATRERLPGWQSEGTGPVVEALRTAGFDTVGVTRVDAIRVGGKPPFVVVAHKARA